MNHQEKKYYRILHVSLSRLFSPYYNYVTLEIIATANASYKHCNMRKYKYSILSSQMNEEACTIQCQLRHLWIL